MITDLVSIVIPTYNRANLISETLDSILSQTHTHWECLVIDDGSTDNTAEVLAQYCIKDNRFKYLKRPAESPKGGNAARNYGFECSKGDFIQWFDDDDIMAENYLSARIALFTKKRKIVICSGFSTDENLNITREVKLKTDVNLYKEYALWKFEIYTPSVLFRKSFLKESPFNETIIRGQETEFFTRIFYGLNPEEYSIINKPLFYYRSHSKSKTEQSQTYNKRHKEDLLHISKLNFERALKLKDLDLIYFYYKLLLKQFFRSVDNDHNSNAKQVISFLNRTLNERNRILKFKLILFSKIYLSLKKGTILKKHLRSHKILT
ncbi:glycosyltransferase family 2 protein [Psychroserpens ponticola]|uniref:Glycosyltransferase family 2 protein n=1 Tax=Psychroserpens ponticola TaxID=2932268 RepID=A0ABY7S0S9_9FLAO|nr:glycosyltransferase family 2 protein [Psychroserpens ponticola]WCO02526.1 glycosyltransferase family 2 protein [Psychroserpens ponticola]